MTTAHRPTWNSAMGAASGTGISQGGYLTGGTSFQKSVRDIPAQMTLKERQAGQGTVEEINKRDLLAELEAAERKHYDEVKKKGTGTVPAVYAAATAPLPAIADMAQASGGGGGTTVTSAHTPAPVGLTSDEVAVLAQFNDADADLGEMGDSSSDDSDDSDDEDDTAALMAELEKIKAERMEEAARRAAEEDELSRKEASAAAMSGNPLMGAGGGSATLRRRWDDDVVFRAQTATEPTKKRRFINDTIRNDFHRSFLSKYIK